MLKRKETSHLSRPWLECDPMASLFVENAHSLKRTKLGEKPYWGRAWWCNTMVKESMTQVITGDITVITEGGPRRLRFGGEGGLRLWDGVKRGVIWKAIVLRKFAGKRRCTTTRRSLGWCHGSHRQRSLPPPLPLIFSGFSNYDYYFIVVVSKAFFLFGFGFLRFRSVSELGVFCFVDVFSMPSIFLDSY